MSLAPLRRQVSSRLVRAYGRVDLTNGLTKYMIFRVATDPEDRWNIIEQDGLQLRTLDQSSFEDAFKSLLE